MENEIKKAFSGLKFKNKKAVETQETLSCFAKAATQAGGYGMYLKNPSYPTAWEGKYNRKALLVVDLGKKRMVLELKK